MDGIYTLPEDVELHQRIMKLFDEWRSVVNSSSEIPDDDKASFVSDGFYPGYTNQKVRVLFVGRESLQMGNADYIEEIYPRFQSNDINGWTLDRYKFFAMQFYIAYGFNRGFPDWNTGVPWASELAKAMVDPDGVSFAFMNISKFTNWSEDDWQTNWELVARSIRNARDDDFLAREVSILAPDVICTMNIACMFGDFLGELAPLPRLSRGGDVAVYEIKLRGGRTVPLLDMWHFSAPGKSPCGSYYDPVRKLHPGLLKRFPSLDPHIKRA